MSKFDDLLRDMGIPPWTEEEKAGEWQCDGCHIIGTFDVVNDHILTAGVLRDGTLKENADITCWGSMKVGSQTWSDYWDRGIHPMTTVMGEVSKIIKDLD
jgi:hypothetical protein